MSVTVESLKSYEKLCRDAANDSRDESLFTRVVAEAPTALGLTQRKLADLLEVSPASVTRYAQGKNFPHHTARRTFCDLLADTARGLYRGMQDRVAAAPVERARPAAERPAIRRAPTPAYGSMIEVGMRAHGAEKP
jgi:transcriptional regulator with XRE-family HTH domain